MDERYQRLRQARIAKGFETAAAAADAFGWNRNTYASNENGNAPFSYRRAKEYAAAFGVPGRVVGVEVDTDEVLVKRLLRGSRAGRFDLESIAGPTRQDAKLRWAAHITAIIPPYQARRIIRGAA